MRLCLLPCLALLLASTACNRRSSPPGAGAPSALRDTLLESDSGDDFKVLAESFGDVRILRYRVPAFERLPLSQKMVLHALQEAALSGRDIVYDQGYAHNLSIRRTLEAVIAHAQASKQTESEAYRALLHYLKRIWFSNGVIDPVSKRKFVPEGVTPEQFASLVRLVDPKALPRRQGEGVDALLGRITPLIFDASLARAGAGQATVPAAEAPDAGTETQEGRLVGPYGPALEECVRWLTQAAASTESDAERAMLEALIAFYRSGQVEDLERYRAALLKDAPSSFALLPGLGTSDGQTSALSGRAQIELVDADAARRGAALREHAAWFEQSSPIDDAFKNAQIVGRSLRVVQSVVSVGDVATLLRVEPPRPQPSGLAQPNALPPVLLSNIATAYAAAQRDTGVLSEFAASEREQSRARTYAALASTLQIELHEAIGHASGKSASSAADAAGAFIPSDRLGPYGSTLEEARADLVALYYLLDPELIELRMTPSLELGRAAYDAYLRDALVQVAALPADATLRGDPMRHRVLIAQWIMREGAGQAVERLSRDGKTYYVVRDYPKLQKLFGRLLHEVQRIESEGDLEAARNLVETFGAQIEPTLHTELRARYAALHVAPYTGFIQPELVPVTKADQIVDVRVEYPTDFTAQQLRYSAKYSFLPTPP